jgi:hypothetical protein
MTVDRITIYTQITPKVSGDDVVSNVPPLARLVKSLVDPAVVTERRFANFPPEV